MPQSKELGVQLDGKGSSDLEFLAKRAGLTPEQLAARIINEALDRMTRTEPGRSNVRSFRKG